MSEFGSETFRLGIAKFAAKAKVNLEEFCVEFVQDLAEEIVNATPVKTGFLRASWWSSIDVPETHVGDRDPEGSATVAKLNLVAADFKPGHVYYFMNGAAYAIHVEYGTTTMEPREYVRGTVRRAKEIAAETVARIRNR